MMRQFWPVAVLAFAGTAAGGEELAAGKSIRVYRVADLVATAAVHSAGSSVSHLPREALQQEHPETLAALERLGTLIATMVPAEDGVVDVLPESLSLVIRRSPDDHAAIAELLNELRQEPEPALEFTATVFADTDTKDASGQAALEELVKTYFHQFASKYGLSPDESDRIRERFCNIQGVMVELPTVRVRPGFRTTWGTSTNPMSVTVLTGESDETVTLRIDAPIDDPANGDVPVRTSKLEITLGHSFLYQNPSPLDGCIYLVTIQKHLAAVPKTTAVPAAAALK